MGAKQSRGSAGAGWPPVMVLGPRKWDVRARSRATGKGWGDAASSFARTLPGCWGTSGWGARSPAPGTPILSCRQSKPRRLLAGSPPQRRRKPAAVPPAAPSCPTTVTSSIPGGRGSLGMAASAHRKGARGERSSLGVLGCITRHPRQLPWEAAAGLCSAAGNPRGLAPVRRGREKASLAGGDSPN